MQAGKCPMGKFFDSIEAVKTVSDFLLPMSRKIVEFNIALEANPA
jgi:glycine cleavage system H lipoate-binding protein